VAFLSGWYSARRGAADTREADGARDSLRSDYFKGINYLLNEQPDKAIEVFIRVLEVDRETVETHLALGNLYRRRGEVDRAIRIHQNLIARPHLSREQHYEGLLELGQDYLSAGLLDRAENLFQELVESGAHRVQALRQLIDIYEQERDWDNAIACARKLEQSTGNQLGHVIAHYRCELAEHAREEGDPQRALENAREALRSHAGCVRASLIEGDLLAERGDTEAALESYERVERQDPDYLTEAIDRVRACYLALGRTQEMADYLAGLLERHGGTTVALALADIKRDANGARAAMDFMAERLRQRASIRGLDRLLHLELEAAGERSTHNLEILGHLTHALLEDRPAYKCQHCGFPAKSLHWQCPGCKHWSSIRPIQGVEGE
jgi:lipopolysaccharide assembly protein B